MKHVLLFTFYLSNHMGLSDFKEVVKYAQKEEIWNTEEQPQL